MHCKLAAINMLLYVMMAVALPYLFCSQPADAVRIQSVDAPRYPGGSHHLDRLPAAANDPVTARPRNDHPLWNASHLVLSEVPTASSPAPKLSSDSHVNPGVLATEGVCLTANVSRMDTVGTDVRTLGRSHRGRLFDCLALPTYQRLVAITRLDHLFPIPPFTASLLTAAHPPLATRDPLLTTLGLRLRHSWLMDRLELSIRADNLALGPRTEHPPVFGPTHPMVAYAWTCRPNQADHPRLLDASTEGDYIAGHPMPALCCASPRGDLIHIHASSSVRSTQRHSTQTHALYTQLGQTLLPEPEVLVRITGPPPCLRLSPPPADLYYSPVSPYNPHVHTADSAEPSGLPFPTDRYCCTFTSITATSVVTIRSIVAIKRLIDGSCPGPSLDPWELTTSPGRPLNRAYEPDCAAMTESDPTVCTASHSHHVRPHIAVSDSVEDSSTPLTPITLSPVSFPLPPSMPFAFHHDCRTWSYEENVHFLSPVEYYSILLHGHDSHVKADGERHGPGTELHSPLARALHRTSYNAYKYYGALPGTRHHFDCVNLLLPAEIKDESPLSPTALPPPNDNPCPLHITVYDLPHHDKPNLDRAIIHYLREIIDELFEPEDPDATISRQSFLVGHTVSGIGYIRLSRRFAGSTNARIAALINLTGILRRLNYSAAITCSHVECKVRDITERITLVPHQVDWPTHESDCGCPEHSEPRYFGAPIPLSIFNFAAGNPVTVVFDTDSDDDDYSLCEFRPAPATPLQVYDPLRAPSPTYEDMSSNSETEDSETEDSEDDWPIFVGQRQGPSMD